MSKIMLSLIIGLITVSAQAQHMLDVIEASSNSMHSISEVKKITFPQDNLKIDFLNGTTKTFSLRDIQLVSFKGVANSTQKIILKPENKFLLYPVPASNVLNILYKAQSNTNLNIQLINIQGQVVVSERSAVMQGENTLELSVEHLKSGIYFCRISEGNISSTQKLSKK